MELRLGYRWLNHQEPADCLWVCARCTVRCGAAAKHFSKRGGLLLACHRYQPATAQSAKEGAGVTRSPSRRLEDWEQTHLARLLAETNPNRLQPSHREIFEGIRDWFNRCVSRGQDVWLTEKQIAAVRRSHYTAQRVQAKLDQPRHYDAEERLNVWCNPMRPRG